MAREHRPVRDGAGRVVAEVRVRSDGTGERLLKDWKAHGYILEIAAHNHDGIDRMSLERTYPTENARVAERCTVCSSLGGTTISLIQVDGVGQASNLDSGLKLYPCCSGVAVIGFDS